MMRHLTLLTPAPATRVPSPGREAGAGLPIESYADLALTLGAPHGPDCPDLVCADARVASGHVPMPVDPWDLVGVRWLP